MYPNRQNRNAAISPDRPKDDLIQPVEARSSRLADKRHDERIKPLIIGQDSAVALDRREPQDKSVQQPKTQDLLVVSTSAVIQASDVQRNEANAEPDASNSKIKAAPARRPKIAAREEVRLPDRSQDEVKILRRGANEIRPPASLLERLSAAPSVADDPTHPRNPPLSLQERFDEPKPSIADRLGVDTSDTVNMTKRSLENVDTADNDAQDDEGGGDSHSSKRRRGSRRGGAGNGAVGRGNSNSGGRNGKRRGPR